MPLKVQNMGAWWTRNRDLEGVERDRSTEGTISGLRRRLRLRPGLPQRVEVALLLRAAIKGVLATR
jgi:hypothetical protein